MHHALHSDMGTPKDLEKAISGWGHDLEKSMYDTNTNRGGQGLVSWVMQSMYTHSVSLQGNANIIKSTNRM